MWFVFVVFDLVVMIRKCRDAELWWYWSLELLICRCVSSGFYGGYVGHRVGGCGRVVGRL